MLVKKYHILIMLMMGIFLSCQNDMDVVMDISGDSSEPSQIISDAEYTFTERGKLKNKLFAGLMKQYNNDSTYILIEGGLKLEIYDYQEQLTAQLTSKEGIYYENSGRMEAIDSVVFENVEGETLLTERLVWLQDSSIIYSVDPITIHRDGGIIYGDGIVSNESFTKYSITKPRGDLEVKNNSNFGRLMTKVSLYLEKFWLVVAILTAAYAIYLLAIGEEVKTFEYVFPIIALLLFGMRRMVRKRMESAKNQQGIDQVPKK